MKKTGVRQMIFGILGTASDREAAFVKEIEDSTKQISDAIQSNSAASEETSATSEELSAEADSLEGLVERFKLR